MVTILCGWLLSFFGGNFWLGNVVPPLGWAGLSKNVVTAICVWSPDFKKLHKDVKSYVVSTSVFAKYLGLKIIMPYICDAKLTRGQKLILEDIRSLGCCYIRCLCGGRNYLPIKDSTFCFLTSLYQKDDTREMNLNKENTRLDFHLFKD